MQTTKTNSIYWSLSPQFPPKTLDVLSEAARAIQKWLLMPYSGSENSANLRGKFLLQVNWEPSNMLWRKAGFHHVEFLTIYIDPDTIDIEKAIHEYAHVIDNLFSSHQMATIFGGGPADDLLLSLGGTPDLFLPRFRAGGYEKILKLKSIELNPTSYGRLYGPAEDFAESFRLAVLHPELLKNTAPLRYKWFEDWRRQIFHI